MNWFSSLKVGTKLIGAFMAGACVAAVIGALGLESTGRIKSLASLMYERETVGLRYAADARMNLVAAGRAARGALLAANGQDRDREVAAMESYFQRHKQALDSAAATLATESEKSIATDAGAAVSAYEAKLKEIISPAPADAGGRAGDSLAILLSGALPLATRAEALITALLAQKQSNADALNHETELVYARARRVMMWLTLGGVLLGIAAGMLLARSLTRQLGGEPGDVARVANAIAQGDLTTPIDASRAVQGSIVQAISRMQESLRMVVGSVSRSSDSIAEGSGQIAAGNADLSQRTEEQAANLTQTAAAMEQLSSTVQSNADVAGQAARLASSASSAASNGGQVVNGVVATMGEIDNSSRKISDIIGVVDSIAFQTNILALNAAVEAARAGEGGRGFAVVAAEVRRLAQNSAAAASDIKALIGDSVQKVEAGRKMVDMAGAAMADVVAQVKRVNDLISEISAATVEQTAGLGQVNQAVLQLSEATQQNAALVEESALATSNLNEQARQLALALRAFNVGHTAAAIQPVAAAFLPPAPLRRRAGSGRPAAI
ncbi:methyl-accepting chemotaxis protein [Pollutimonas bauzanensis]|uniref:Methyl-accepting chemotaxis protein n=1 Tax=Pollutimonas bauzanensis TaxID=658167 RepID=A0A1M5ZN58_9BURK|nr:methyl-accepting chemotaxis protein [Pollutimonas bauzanensis]SHI25727.1 methyl-accepting chemotaxis protein [Pollutimonas bauzanensis]